MTDFPDWQYDEFKQIGTDYESIEEVARYDARMAELRNIHEECTSIIRAIDLMPESRVLDIGAGTGEFVIAAAQKCAQVCAVDISQIMLDYARRKAEDCGLDNIVFTRAGFLTYCNDGEPFDAAVTQLALHHLPDFWKAVALRMLWNMLKEGGRLFIRDVVFSFDIDNAAASVNQWIDASVCVGGDAVGKEIERHVRQEFSTFGWVMEGLLQSSGFSILRADYQDGGTLAEYLCQKS